MHICFWIHLLPSPALPHRELNLLDSLVLLQSKILIEDWRMKKGSQCTAPGPVAFSEVVGLLRGASCYFTALFVAPVPPRTALDSGFWKSPPLPFVPPALGVLLSVVTDLCFVSPSPV